MGVVYFSIIPTFEPSRYCKCWIVCFYIRKCVATGIYVVSDVYSENDWKLGWEGNDIKRAVGAVIDMIIESIR